MLGCFGKTLDEDLSSPDTLQPSRSTVPRSSLSWPLQSSLCVLGEFHRAGKDSAGYQALNIWLLLQTKPGSTTLQSDAKLIADNRKKWRFLWGFGWTVPGEMSVRGGCKQLCRCVPGYLQLQPRISHPQLHHYCDKTLVIKYNFICELQARWYFLYSGRPELRAWIDPWREPRFGRHTSRGQRVHWTPQAPTWMSDK